MAQGAPQLQFDFAWRDAAALEADLTVLCGRPVHVTVTDNTSSMSTVRHDPKTGAVTLRIHRMFLYADPAVVRALAQWIKRPKCKRNGPIVDRFIREHRHLIRERKPNAVRLITEGEHHDLQAYYDEVNAQEFDGAVNTPITWGRRPTRRRRRSIRFGSYSVQDNLIRIHPFLDAPFVPQYFVRYVVFHEMLHAHLGIEEPETGRRRIHTPEFNAREREYADYERAAAWENNSRNLRRLLR
jgi:predicted metal-dependent hydrolase